MLRIVKTIPTYKATPELASRLRSSVARLSRRLRERLARFVRRRRTVQERQTRHHVGTAIAAVATARIG